MFLYNYGDNVQGTCTMTSNIRDVKPTFKILKNVLKLSKVVKTLFL